MRPQLPCPYCQAPATQMPVISDVSVVDFFLCESCGKVSERSKDAALAGAPLSPSPLASLSVPSSAVSTAGRLQEEVS